MIDWDKLGDQVLDEVLTCDQGADADVGSRYLLSACIGSGGQGRVYRAYDRCLERPVAVKIVHQVTGNPHLEAEASLLAGFFHDAIPSVYDRGYTADGRAFLVLTLIEGTPLHQWIKDPQHPTASRLRVFRRIASALAHAHQQGILHRDCKPANIMVGADERAWLLDWGLAAGDAARAVCGTPCYAAPEQLNGQVADQRSDIYSLGVLLYEMLSAALPFARIVDDFDEFARLRAGLGCIPLARHRPDLSSSCQEVINRAMAAQPAARYPSCTALIADVDQLIAGRPTSVDRPHLPWHWLLGALGLAGLCLCALGLGYWLGRQGPDDRASRPPEPAPAQWPQVGAWDALHSDGPLIEASPRALEVWPLPSLEPQFQGLRLPSDRDDAPPPLPDLPSLDELLPE